MIRTPMIVQMSFDVIFRWALTVLDMGILLFIFFVFLSGSFSLLYISHRAPARPGAKTTDSFLHRKSWIVCTASPICLTSLLLNTTKKKSAKNHSYPIHLCFYIKNTIKNSETFCIIWFWPGKTGEKYQFHFHHRTTRNTRFTYKCKICIILSGSFG